MFNFLAIIKDITLCYFLCVRLKRITAHQTVNLNSVISGGYTHEAVQYKTAVPSFSTGLRYYCDSMLWQIEFVGLGPLLLWSGPCNGGHRLR